MSSAPAQLLASALHELQRRSRRNKLDALVTLLRPTPQERLLEVGVGNTEPLPSTNFVVRAYPYPRQVTALGLGDLSGFQALHPEVPTRSFDGGRFPCDDGEFDLAHSNAVIEHVGTREAQRHFLSEVVRVARRGMVTTPNKHFLIETHTLLPLLHWGSKAQFDRALALLGPERIARVFSLLGREFPVQELADLRLLSAGDLERLAREVGLRRFRVVKNRVAGVAMTLSLLYWAD